MDPRKDSVLDKDADIFKKRDESKYEDKKNLTKDEKRTRFKEYYLKGLIVGLIAFAIVAYVYIDGHILHPSPDYNLQIACVGVTFDAKGLQENEKKANEYLGFDGKKEAAMIENYASGDISAAAIKFQATMSTGDLDFGVLDADNFVYNALAGSFADVTEYLSDDEKKFFKDRIVYMDVDNLPTDEDRKKDDFKPSSYLHYGEDGAKIKNKKALGIKLEQEDKWCLKAANSKDKVAIFAPIASSKDQDIVKKYLKCFCEIEMDKKK